MSLTMSGVSLVIPVTSQMIHVNYATGFSLPVIWEAPIRRQKHGNEPRTCLISWEGNRPFKWAKFDTTTKHPLNFFYRIPNKLSFDLGYRRCCLSRSQHFHSRYGARTEVQS
jgi:hypothetical protein